MNLNTSPVASFISGGPWEKWIKIATYVLLWSIPGIAALSFYYLNQTLAAAPVDWQYALVSTLPNWYIWALIAPGIALVLQRNPIEDVSLTKLVFGVHVPVLIIALLLHSGLNLILFWVTGLHDTMTLSLFSVHFMTRMYGNTFTYVALVGLIYAYEFYRQNALRKHQAALLQVQLAQANLRALKMQIHPHFLFNTLHSIAALVRKTETTLAVNMLGQLGDFLRLALENKGRQEIPLRQELDFLERYLALEKIRFSDRLTVNITAPDLVQNYYVPNLILQPIVENAIHHGISPNASDGLIDVSVDVTEDRLCISVQDNGSGLKNPDRLTSGQGVKNTQNRLRNLYGSDQEFSFHPSDCGGLEVRICIPKLSQPIMNLVPELA